MNINPRSCYGKSKELGQIITQYSASLICISESWSRENLPLQELVQIEGFEVVTNVKQRSGRGGKPALLVDTRQFHVIKLCPNPITVPVEVEAVWVLIKPKQTHKQNKNNYIAICSYYFVDSKTTPTQILYDHFAETYNLLISKYGENLHFICSADSNQLNLDPILDLSPSLKQVVQIPTRLNPPATLDTVITTLSAYYNAPVTKPPVEPDVEDVGKPSDHLVVLWTPSQTDHHLEPRQYRQVSLRPMLESKTRLD